MAGPGLLNLPMVILWCTEYSMEWLVTMVNADLANTLGNLLLRISSKKLNSGGKGWIYHRDLFPFCEDGVTAATRARQEDHDLIRSLHELPGTSGPWDNLDISSVLKPSTEGTYANCKSLDLLSLSLRGMMVRNSDKQNLWLLYTMIPYQIVLLLFHWPWIISPVTNILFFRYCGRLLRDISS